MASKGMPVNLFNYLGNIDKKRQLSVSVKNVIPVITQTDIDKKTKTRYFAKHVSQKNGNIYELDGGQYSKIEDSSVFYKTTMDWVIRGKLEDTILTLPSGDTILIKGIISQNKELIALAEEELPGITRHLKNYIEFYVGA